VEQALVLWDAMDECADAAALMQVLAKAWPLMRRFNEARLSTTRRRWACPQLGSLRSHLPERLAHGLVVTTLHTPSTHANLLVAKIFELNCGRRSGRLRDDWRPRRQARRTTALCHPRAPRRRAARRCWVAHAAPQAGHLRVRARGSRGAVVSPCARRYAAILCKDKIGRFT